MLSMGNSHIVIYLANNIKESPDCCMFPEVR